MEDHEIMNTAICAREGFLKGNPEQIALGLLGFLTLTEEGSGVSDERWASLAVDALNLSDLEYRARVHLQEEQGKPLPDNALIALLCDTVRLCREQADLMGRPFERPIEELLDRLMVEANKRTGNKIVIRGIQYGEAGWGVLWHDGRSLKVYHYYSTIRQAIESEMRRMLKEGKGDEEENVTTDDDDDHHHPQKPVGEPPDAHPKPVEELLDELMVFAGEKKDIALYDIHYCRAGWGVLWHEDDGHKQVYAYYPTVRQMIEGETKRLKGESDG